MKNIIFAFLILSIFSACANEPKNPTSKDNTVTTNLPLNPNGDSELALLMRKMENHWKETKKSLEAGEETIEIPDFSALLTATPTDESMSIDELHGFATSYLNQVKALKNAKGEEQKMAYNNIINGCIMCHENSCSGPIPRIQKLLIKE